MMKTLMMIIIRTFIINIFRNLLNILFHLLRRTVISLIALFCSKTLR